MPSAFHNLLYVMLHHRRILDPPAGPSSNQSTLILVAARAHITKPKMAADAARRALTVSPVGLSHCVMRVMLRMRWLRGIESGIKQRREQL